MNIKSGKDHWNYGKHWSEKIKQKMKDNHTDFSGENNPNWRGGISFKIYPKEFNNQLKQTIRDRYNNCDYISGIHKDICNKQLDVHHVNYDKSYGCGSLYIPCHMKINLIENIGRT